ncbi:PREDICTED: uncharacterized protein LOC104823468 isoform X2 [Tarenaya hassleriana]|uniref:uncharacterized protein LOC104823468 isoform X2 n=1 Tax=Tarenaya hassleriana TaxID=28532 RepID=UPI00053C522C|nr:PREDICTED: uncharacterized protein LOC104823468 isoform X2 [Tarenaya hassleriana]
MAEKSKGVGFSEGDASDSDPDRTELSFVLEKLSLGSAKKKKLLILSLGGVLVRRFHVADKWKLPKNRSPHATYGLYYVYKRPFCEEFLRFCLDRFEVGIWSSAMERNVDVVLNIIMKGLKGKLLFVMDQNDCTDSGFMSLEKKTKPLFFKDLSKVFQKVNSETDEPPQFSYTNTLLMDDNPYKAFLNPIPKESCVRIWMNWRMLRMFRNMLKSILLVSLRSVLLTRIGISTKKLQLLSRKLLRIMVFKQVDVV